mmetsp:Transcript_46620/g.125184  ORF Transcript_46620/g.125184 Transcript_46620/m.125184 type:complete len:367 (+) Transcript_46620:1300-2400(+)
MMSASKMMAHPRLAVESTIMSARRLSSLKNRKTRNTLTIRSILTVFMPVVMFVLLSPAPSPTIKSMTDSMTRAMSKRFQPLFSLQKYCRPCTDTRMMSSIRKNRLQVYPPTVRKSDSWLWPDASSSTSRPMITELSAIIMAHVESNRGCSTNHCIVPRSGVVLSWNLVHFFFPRFFPELVSSILWILGLTVSYSTDIWMPSSTASDRLSLAEERRDLSAGSCTATALASIACGSSMASSTHSSSFGLGTSIHCWSSTAPASPSSFGEPRCSHWSSSMGSTVSSSCCGSKLTCSSALTGAGCGHGRCGHGRCTSSWFASLCSSAFCVALQTSICSCDRGVFTDGAGAFCDRRVRGVHVNEEASSSCI